MNRSALILLAVLLFAACVARPDGASYPITDFQGFKYRFKRKVTTFVQPQCVTLPCPPLEVVTEVYERQGTPGVEFVLKLGTTLNDPIFVKVGT